MAYRVKYTVVRPFPWEGRTYQLGEEFCDEFVTDYQLDMLTRRGSLSKERAVIHSRIKGAKSKTVAAREVA